jgi:hypothetical protein
MRIQFMVLSPGSGQPSCPGAPGVCSARFLKGGEAKDGYSRQTSLRGPLRDEQTVDPNTGGETNEKVRYSRPVGAGRHGLAGSLRDAGADRSTNSAAGADRSTNSAAGRSADSATADPGPSAD